MGDCEVIYKLKNGTVFRFKKTELDKLDEKAIEILKKTAKEKNISVKESLPFIKDVLRKHRAMKNTPSGYEVFEPQKNPSFSLYKKRLKASEVESFFVCSDGFAQCFTTLKIFSSCEELFKTDMTVKDICRKIQKVSFEDKELNKYPRFKITDDITVIKVIM